MVTYARLLADRQVTIRELVTGQPDLVIRWVATSELSDPTPYFEGGEILLTTGIQTSGWTSQWHDFAQALCDAGTVALGFGVGLTHATTPPELIEACVHTGLNLFEVPRQTPFVAVSHRVARLLVEEEAETAQHALDVQRRLTAVAAKPNGSAAVMRALSHALHGAVALIGTDGTAQFGPEGVLRDTLVIADLMPEVHRLWRAGKRAAATLSVGATALVLQPIGVSGRRSRILAVVTPAPLTEVHRSAITTAVALLGLIDEQGRSAAETRRRIRGRAIDLLLAGDVQTATLVLGMDVTAPGLPRRCRMIRATGSAEDCDDALTMLEQAEYLATRQDSEVWVLAGDGTESAAARYLTDNGLLAGIGSRTSLDGVAESHRTAKAALQQATTSAPLIEWDAVWQDSPLGLIDAEVAAEYSASFLRNLDEDQRNTLRCFLRHNGSHLKMAQELGVHRNTVRNRLNEIGAGLSGSLDDPQVRVSAWIALQSERT